MLGFDFFVRFPLGGAEADDLAGAGCGLASSGFASGESLLDVTPKKLATASQELLSLDFSTFGFSSASSTPASFASGCEVKGIALDGTAGSDLGFWGAREGVPSKLASEFQWSDMESESP
jgi:hypothetical protein